MTIVLQLLITIMGCIIGHLLFIATESALYIRRARIEGFRCRIPTYRAFKVVFRLVRRSPFSELPPFSEFALFEKFPSDVRANNSNNEGN